MLKNLKSIVITFSIPGDRNGVSIMKMYEDKEATYEVRLLCRNCNTEWVESIEKGTHVRYEKDNNYMIKIGNSFEKRKFFNCPKCGTHTKIARLTPTKISRQ